MQISSLMPSVLSSFSVDGGFRNKFQAFSKAFQKFVSSSILIVHWYCYHRNYVSLFIAYSFKAHIFRQHFIYTIATLLSFANVPPILQVPSSS